MKAVGVNISQGKIFLDMRATFEEIMHLNRMLFSTSVSYFAKNL